MKDNKNIQYNNYTNFAISKGIANSIHKYCAYIVAKNATVMKITDDMQAFIVALFYVLCHYSPNISDEIFDNVKVNLNERFTRNYGICRMAEKYYNIIYYENMYFSDFENQDRDSQLLCLKKLSKYADNYLFKDSITNSDDLYKFFYIFCFKPLSSYLTDSVKRNKEKKEENKITKKAPLKKKKVIIGISIFLIIVLGGVIFLYSCSKSDDIQLIYVTSPVNPGEEAHIEIKGEPSTEYYIAVHYNSGISTAQGLIPKTTDEDGYATWYWNVGTRTSSGTYIIKIYNYKQESKFEFTVN